MSALAIDNVSKRFDGVEVLKGIDLSLAHGEFLVLLGSSGCGKSTLLNIIAGLLEPTSGDVRIGDRSVIGIHPKDRDIAMVFQSYALYPNMTVERNIGFGLEMRRVPAAERREAVHRAAAILQIEPLLARRPAELSGGQRQRVAIGRALVRKPAVFLFDEPLSNLDAKLRMEMRGELRRLHELLGATVVYVTHDQIEAMTLATPHSGDEPRPDRTDRHAQRDLRSPGKSLCCGFCRIAGYECAHRDALPRRHCLDRKTCE